MHSQPVEIYSDAINAAIMRHPGRRFPGTLIQGDTLYTLCQAANAANRSLSASSPDLAAAREELDWLCDALQGRLEQYKQVLAAHDIPLPFHESSAGI